MHCAVSKARRGRWLEYTATSNITIYDEDRDRSHTSLNIPPSADLTMEIIYIIIK